MWWDMIGYGGIWDMVVGYDGILWNVVGHGRQVGYGGIS